MRKAIPFLATVLCGLLAASGACAAEKRSRNSGASTGKQTYKWVDEHGVTHYGDSLPSEYSQREQTVINKQGVVVQTWTKCLPTGFRLYMV